MSDEGFRLEKDSMGTVRVPEDRHWGAQTQRSLENFRIGSYRMPVEIVRAFGALKLACAEVNRSNGDVPAGVAEHVITACREVWEGRLDDHFPLVVFQTGSGTQTNMNANEVISHRATELRRAVDPDSSPIHPNDHVNRGQSSNDTFPTAMHLSVALKTRDKLIPALTVLRDALLAKEEAFREIIKCGRTHTMDATPVTLGQEFSAFRTQIDLGIGRVTRALETVQQLAIGGTAVGTGLNTREDFGDDVCSRLSESTGIEFTSMANKFEGLASHDTMVEFHGALNVLACSLMKIANDLRFLSSGPRCGIGEIVLPANEPGSSIMPGKINPTQCEAVTMVACEVMGNQTTVSVAASNGHFQLNVFKPVIIFKVLESMDLIADACVNFTNKCVDGIVPNEERIEVNLKKTLMLVTALNPVIGYDKAAIVAKKAYAESISLKEAVTQLGFLSGEEFDLHLRPEKMVIPKPSTKKRSEE